MLLSFWHALSSKINACYDVHQFLGCILESIGSIQVDTDNPVLKMKYISGIYSFILGLDFDNEIAYRFAASFSCSALCTALKWTFLVRIS
jgi:hypothetical protein